MHSHFVQPGPSRTLCAKADPVDDGLRNCYLKTILLTSQFQG